MAKQYVIEPETKQLLRGQQRHACLFRRTVPLTLVALDAGRDQILRRAFAALRSRQDVIERQVLGMLMLSAILATITVANIDSGPLHGRFAVLAANMNIMPQPHNGRHRKNRRGRMKDIVAVVFLNENGAAKPQAHGTGYPDRS